MDAAQRRSRVNELALLRARCQLVLSGFCSSDSVRALMTKAFRQIQFARVLQIASILPLIALIDGRFRAAAAAARGCDTAQLASQPHARTANGLRAARWALS